MVWFWRFIFGFLTIKIYGENGERVLNAAAYNGINIWNLHCKKGSITGNISIKDFIKLRYAKRGIKCKIKIMNKKGIVFYTNKYKNRFGFIAGAIIFAFVLIILSNFVWIINVEGNNQIPSAEIINSCKKIGIYEGILKNKINSKYDAQRLSLQQKDIAWCSLNVEGSVLTVNLSETAVSDKEQRQNLSNLKADFEGKIKKIDVTSGNTVVKVGDTVSKGDLLVSGVIQNLSSIHFVHSEGVVIAETKRTFSAKGEYIQAADIKTGDKIKKYTIQFFNIKIPLYLGNVKQRYNHTVDVKNLMLFGEKIPIKIACERYDILQETKVAYDKVTLEEMLYNNIKNQVDEFDFISVSEGEKEIIYTEKGMLLNIVYFCEENIAVQDKILLNTEN